MEIFLSALLGELASRSINFFIHKISKKKVLDMEDSLQRALLRAQVIVDEAKGRHITNQAMMQQLDMLRDAMHRGCYILDTFRYQSYDDDEDTKDQSVSHSLSPSILNSQNGIRSSNRKLLLLEQLQESLNNLSSLILDVNEAVVFLASNPRLCSQPYNMHILLGNCMFDRQSESELVINFLLRTNNPHGSQEFEVLPIVGPGKVGKSTLVTYVCMNERVRDHFSEILFLRDHDLTDDGLSKFREGCTIKHQNHIPNTKKEHMRWLLVVDLVGDLNEDAWDRLYSSCKRCMPSNSKIIVTNRSDKIIMFGTINALSLKYLSREALWYYFKTVTFGSMDPKMHPRLVHLAMEFANLMIGSLMGANIMASLLRDNFDNRFWRKTLAFFRGFIQRHVSKYGVHPIFLINQNRSIHLGRVGAPFEDLVFCSEYESCSQEEVPKIKVHDVMYGNAKATLGKFEALAWRSPIPPYSNYVYSCEIRELKSSGRKRKRSTNACNMLCSAIRHVTDGGSKIIVTSRSDKIIKFGTTRPLRIKYLSQEAYWYFFKALTFGSMDPKMHPRLANLAMEMANMLNGCFIGANMTACLLRDNFDIRFWRNVLAFLRGITKNHVHKSCVHPLEVMNLNRPAHLRRMATPSEGFVVYHLYQCSSQEEVPKLKIVDVICGSIKPY
ncbi:hypothetical protein U9M48_011414 [Paspalum notatum var. saurae]|uniref:NB-ARC domain-containing protein n=1 Tax=Paspalum notatum var. saurae TaxID=547442 RepID=A0AAQ3WHF8_PASNO